jgi:hypothetical protein
MDARTMDSGEMDPHLSALHLSPLGEVGARPKSGLPDFGNEVAEIGNIRFRLAPGEGA